MDGVYQAFVSLVRQNTSNAGGVYLQVNGVSFAQSLQSDTHAYQNSAIIQVLIQLRMDDVRQVLWESNYASLNNAIANQFYLLFVGN